jgi:hypothetical protein
MGKLKHPETTGLSFDEQRALELRIGANPWETVAVDLGVTPAEAQTIARRALSGLIPDSVDDLRDLAELRLESLYREALVEIKFASTGMTKQGAIKLALSIETRRAQLLGLDRRPEVTS